MTLTNEYVDTPATVADFADLIEQITKPPVKPVPLPVLAQNIPLSMRKRRQWIVWRYQRRGDKWSKLPYMAGSDRPAKTNDKSTWRDLDFCLEQYRAGKADGIGYVFAEGDGLAGIDLDHCFDGHEPRPEAKAIIAQFDGLAYFEKSVGGDGGHLIVKGEMARSGKGSGDLNWIEGYDYASPRYFTFSGHRWEGTSAEEPQEAQEALNWLHENYLKKAEKVRPEGPAAPVFDPADEADDDRLIARIRKSSKQGDKFNQLFDDGTLINRETGEITTDPSSLDMKLVEMLAFWCSRDEAQMDRLFRRSALLRDKWDERRGQRSYGEMTIAKGIKYNLEHGGSAFRDEKKSEPPDPARYKPLRYTDLLTLPDAEEIVEDLLPAEGAFCIYGQSGAGKTFLAIDLMLAIAKGDSEWFGRCVRQTPVLYMALEGQQGIRDRLAAYLLERGGEIPDAFRVIYEPFDITSERDRPDLIQAIKDCGLVNPVVVIDTMTRATPGMDLNGPKDMGAVISGLDEVQRGIGGLVGTVYHSTIKTAGTSEDATEMGHSSYRGSLDASILVYEKDGVKYWFSKKVKDGASGDAFSFSLSVHEVRKNQWDRPKTSCAVIPLTKDEATTVRERRINDHNHAVMQKVINRLWTEDQINGWKKDWSGVPNSACLKVIGGKKTDAIDTLTEMVAMGAIRLIKEGTGRTSAKFYRIKADWQAPDEFQPFPPPLADLSVPEEGIDDI
jgi:hypothetical protein